MKWIHLGNFMLIEQWERLQGYDNGRKRKRQFSTGQSGFSKEEVDIHAACDGVMVLDRHIAPSIRSMVTLRFF